MKTKLDPQEKIRRQAWRDTRYDARVLEEAAKRLRGESPLPSVKQGKRKGRAACGCDLPVLTAASVIAGIEAPRI